jgi:hypothetical protein
MKNSIIKWIRYFLMVSGAVAIIYGFVHDYDLITFGGAFLFISGIMLYSIIEIFTEKINK